MSSTAGRWVRSGGPGARLYGADFLILCCSWVASYWVSPMGFTAGIDPEFQMACAVWRISMASSSRPSGARPSWYGWSAELLVDSSMCACS